MSLIGRSLGLESLSLFARNSPFSFQRNTRLFQISNFSSITSQPADGRSRRFAAAPSLDNTWSFELWRPTIEGFDALDFSNKCKNLEVSYLYSHLNRVPLLTKALLNQDFKRSSALVIQFTESLRKEPHDPYTLTRRASELLCLGYPELAAGDAYKAKIDVQSMMFGLESKRDQISFDEGRKYLESILQWHFEAYNKLMSALCMTRDYKSLLKICEEGRERYDGKHQIEHIVPSMTFFKEAKEAGTAQFNDKQESLEQERFSQEEAQIRLESGNISHLAYPFTPKKYLNREMDLIESTESLFREASSSCMLDYSPVALSSNAPEEHSSKSLGVFATRNIKFAERLVEDTTVFAASTVSAAAPSTLKLIPNSSRICDNCYGSIPTRCRQYVSSLCCNTTYCSARCRDMAKASYHKVLCGQNFDWVYEESRGKLQQFALNGPMWLRILAVCVQSNGHPLDHPSIARLTPLHDKLSRIWTLSNNVITPIRILQQLGIDPIEDFRYDTLGPTNHLDSRHQ